MFEDKKWSPELKAFASEVYSRGVNSTKEEFVRLIETAIAEGQQNVQDDPRRFGLLDEDEARKRERQAEPHPP